MEYLKWVLAGLAAFLHGVPELTWFLLVLMAVDTILGIWSAVVQRDLSSSAMWGGVTKKVGSLLIVALGAAINRFVKVPGIDFVMVFTGFYIGPELLSIIRNAGIVGIPLPPQLVQVLRYFQDKDKPDANRTVP